MFALVFLSVICGSMSAAKAITCQTCMEMTSSSALYNTVLGNTGLNSQPCNNTGGTSEDCSEQGDGCMRMALTFYYTSESAGDFQYYFKMRGCGAPMTMCYDDAAMQKQLEQQRAQFDSTFNGTGLTYNRGEGEMCMCNTGDLCNQVAQATPTTVTMETTTESGASHLMATSGAVLVAIIYALAF